MRARTLVRWTAGVVGVATGVYAGYVASAWVRYGRPSLPPADDADPLLDRFLPRYDVAERHRVRVDASSDLTFAVACEADLMDSPIARAVFKARETLLGADPDTQQRPRGLVALTTSIGWRVLAEVPGRELVVGAVTRPWEANVVFRPVAPDAFAGFDEPDYVKIAWTLRADPAGPDASIFRTETRAAATDAAAAAKFRRYWSFLSPGIIVIRWTMLGPMKREAERRARIARAGSMVAW